MEDRGSLDAAMRGVYGVFSVQPPEWNPSDAATDKEIRMGKNVADAAKDAGVFRQRYYVRPDLWKVTLIRCLVFRMER